MRITDGYLAMGYRPPPKFAPFGRKLQIPANRYLYFFANQETKIKVIIENNAYPGPYITIEIDGEIVKEERLRPFEDKSYEFVVDSKWENHEVTVNGETKEVKNNHQVSFEIS